MVNLDTLNEMQRRAVLKTHGPLLILAGAGSGKTTVLALHLSYRVCAYSAEPYSAAGF